MTGYDWKPANPGHPSVGWVARTRHDGVDVELRVTPGTLPKFCPCYPAPCAQPGVRYVRVSATAFARMETTAFGDVELAEHAQSVHAADGTQAKPCDTADKAAAFLLPLVTAEARVALAELAAHAARLAVSRRGDAKEVAIVTDQGDQVRLAVIPPPGARIATLNCVSPESAATVTAEAARAEHDTHTARQDGRRVLLTYFDRRYPLDIASWAFEHGHASDAEAANTIAAL